MNTRQMDDKGLIQHFRSFPDVPMNPTRKQAMLETLLDTQSHINRRNRTTKFKHQVAPGFAAVVALLIVGVGVIGLKSHLFSQQAAGSSTGKEVKNINTASMHKSSTTKPLQSLLTANAPSTLQTDYGTVSLSTTQSTNSNITVYLTSNGKKIDLYRVSKYGYKQIFGWQADGPYLVIKIGFPPNGNSSTTNMYTDHVLTEDVVINLQSQQPPLMLGGNYRSEFISAPYFVQGTDYRLFGVIRSAEEVINLKTLKHIVFQLPVGGQNFKLLGTGMMSYAVAEGTGKKTITLPLSNSGWLPLNKRFDFPNYVPLPK